MTRHPETPLRLIIHKDVFIHLFLPLKKMRWPHKTFHLLIPQLKMTVPMQLQKAIYLIVYQD